MPKKVNTTPFTSLLSVQTKLSKATSTKTSQKKSKLSPKKLTRKWQVRWLNKYVALKINFQHNRIQANIIDSFPATQIKYYLRRTKLDTHGHIARKRLHMARESFFVLTKILEDLKIQLAHSGTEEIRAVASPILGRIFFRGWNIRLKLRKVIRHIKATYKYTKHTTFSQVAYRTFSRMFSPRKSRRRNRRKKLRSLRRIRYIRQKELRKVKAIRKFTKRYVSAVCTVRPTLTAYRGTPERFLHQQLGFATASRAAGYGHEFRKAMHSQLRYLHVQGFFTQGDDWYQHMHYRRVFALVVRGQLKPIHKKWKDNSSRALRRQKTLKARRYNRGYRKYMMRFAAGYGRKSNIWALHCATQQQSTGRYARRLTLVVWQGILNENVEQLV